VAVFGEAGKHARAAVGAGSLPRGVAVEVDALFDMA
jgi:enamine deaminase RidA (YjgF/YER057c/UK114 family)